MIFDRGIIDKTMMCEAVNHFDMKSAVWVKYRLSLFHKESSLDATNAGSASGGLATL